MTQSIPANFFIKVNPGVVGAGGAALNMVAMVLTHSGELAYNQPVTFPNAAAVGAFFGVNSPEQQFAQIYFQGYDGSTIKPASIQFSYYKTGPQGAWLRNGPATAGKTLTQLQAVTPGTLIMTVDGVLFTSGTINLTGATSFTNAATLILAAFTSPTFTCTYDPIQNTFQFTSGTTGTGSTITYATGTMAAALGFTQGKGAIISIGAPNTSLTNAMNMIIDNTTNWVTLATIFDPDGGAGNTAKQELATWTSAQNFRYCYVCWDSDVNAPAGTTEPTTLGEILTANALGGTALLWSALVQTPNIISVGFDKAAFLCGAIASVNFTRKNGRVNFSYVSQAGLVPDVYSGTAAFNLLDNNYNFYGNVSTAAQQFKFLYDGGISGVYLWVDSYINQIWLNDALQLALLNLLTSIHSIPYNQDGYALVRAACMDPITQALNFGAIRAGVSLSALQAAEVNNAAGVTIDTVLSSQGWYLQIVDPSAQTRSLRQSPGLTLWYADGQSINAIVMSSLDVL